MYLCFVPTEDRGLINNQKGLAIGDEESSVLQLLVKKLLRFGYLTIF